VNRTGSYFTGHLQTKLESANEAKAVVQDVIDEFISKGITEEELHSAKQFLVGSEPLRNETLQQRIGNAFTAYYSDKPLDYRTKELELIESIELDQINDFISSHTEIKKPISKICYNILKVSNGVIMQDAKKLENYTYEDYLQIDQSTKERLELIFGDIYMMAGASAAHQDVVLNLAYLFKEILKEKQSCIPRVAPYDIKFVIGGETSVVQPDVMLFCAKELPCAVFEVLSPSTAHKDMTVKKELYERGGVEEYFLVNIELNVIEKFTLHDERYIYDRAYGSSESMPVDCLEAEIEVDSIFEGYILSEI